MGQGGGFDGNDRYRVEGEIGRGATGIVYRVYDEETQSRVALKWLHHPGADLTAQLKAEFRSRMLHRNLVELFELHESEQGCFFTMELLEGQHFTDYVGVPDEAESLAMASTVPQGAPIVPESEVPVDLPKLAERALRRTSSFERLERALRQLVGGIVALHSADRIHRDIKPSNIKVTPSGRVVLLDFGLVTAWRDVPASGGVGTRYYMAPEAMRGAQLGPQADWYSLGVLLFQSLTQKLPFHGDDATMLARKESLLRPRPRDLNSHVPEHLDELVVGLLHPDPMLRADGFACARALGDESLAGVGDPYWRAPVFVGRATEQERLKAAFAAAEAGASKIVLVEGVSGIGKTELVQQALAKLRRKGAPMILMGRCHFRESIPYKAFDRVLDELSARLIELPHDELDQLAPAHSGALIRMFPVLGRVPWTMSQNPASLDPREERRRGFEALIELLSKIAEKRPIVLWIDDYQWGDAESSVLLRELVTARDLRRTVIMLSYRSEDRHDSPSLIDLNQLITSVGEGPVVRVLPGPFGAAESQSLAEAMVPDGGPIAAERIAKESGGSPFHIAMQARHALRPKTEVPAALGLSVVMSELFEDLGPEQQRIVEVVAVAGAPLPSSVVLDAAGIREQGRRDIYKLGDSCHLRLTLIDGGQAVDIYHTKSRESLLELLSNDRSRELNRKIAEALRASPTPDPDALLRYYEGAGDDLMSGDYALKAAQKAEGKLAFTRAADCWEKVVKYKNGDPGVREYLVHWAEALANAGNALKAGDKYRQAADAIQAVDAGSVRVLDLRRLGAEHYLRGGYLDQGVGLLRELLEAIEVEYPKTPRQALFTAVANNFRLQFRGLEPKKFNPAMTSPEKITKTDIVGSAALGLSWVDRLRTAAFQSRYALMALDGGVPGQAARALASAASELACLGGKKRVAKGEALMSRAAEVAQAAVDDEQLKAFLPLMSGTVAFYTGRWKDALLAARRAEDILRTRCRGVAWELTTSHVLSLAALVYLGNLNELNELLPRVLEEARTRGDRLAFATLATGLPNSSWLAKDQPDSARAKTQQAMAEWPKTDFQFQHYLDLLAQTQIDLYQGEGALALQRLDSAWKSLESAYYLRIEHFRITMIHLRARAALRAAGQLSDRAQLLSRASADAKRLQSEEAAWARPLETAIRAGIAAASSRNEVAARGFDEAAAKFDALGMTLYAAASRMSSGQLAGGDRGQELARAAERAFEERGVMAPGKFAAMLVPGVLTP